VIKFYNRWGADEVGIRLSDMRVKVFTTRQTTRANFNHDHITAMITSSTLGDLCPGYLLFPW
jgi:hypothetical protein